MKSRGKLIYVISGLFIVSFIVQLFLTNFNYRMSLMSSFLQLIVSWVIAQLFHRFLNNQNYSQSGLWMSWFGSVILGAIILHFI